MVLLENFREVLDQLSPELQNRLQRLRTLDEEYEARKTQLLKDVQNHFRQSSNVEFEERTERTAVFAKEFASLRSLAKEKIVLSDNIFLAVQKYHERLTRDYEEYKREMEADNAGITEQLESKFKEGVRIAHGIPPIKPPKPAKRNRLHSIGDEEDLRPKAPAPIARKSSLNIPMDGRMQTVTVQKMLEIRKRSLTMGGPGQSEVTKSFLQSLASAINKRRQSGVVSAQLCRQPLPMVLKEPMTPPIEAALSPNTNQSSPNSTTSRSSTATVVKTNESGGSVLAGPTVVLACSESRHGRQRKPTSRVQELIVDGLQHRPGKLERAAQSSFGINLNLAAVQKELESSAAEPPHKKSRSGTNEEEGAEESEEKTWCICSEKSYGEMVACDNQKCRIEWFHYHCVNISAPPTGTWLCPECTKAKEAGMILLQKKETVVKLQPK